MAIDFPNSPEIYDEYTAPTGRTWYWTGSTWKSKTTDIAAYVADTTDVHGISNTADLAYISDLDSLAPLNSPTFSGIVSLPTETSIGNISSSEIEYLDGLTSSIQDQLDIKAGTSHGHTLSEISDVTASYLEVNILDGVIATTSEINHLSGVTSGIQNQIDNKTVIVADITDLTVSASELNTLDGVTVTAGEINYLAGVTSSIQDQIDNKTVLLADVTDVTATAAEVNKLSGLTASNAELNYLDGVTSAIQDQLDNKSETTHIHNLGDIVDVSATITEVNYVSGVTSSIQDQIDSKAAIADPTFTGTATIPYAQLTPTSTKPSWVEGNLYYDSEEKTLVIQGSGSTFEHTVGQREWVRCRNSSGEIIYKGTPVYITGVHIPGDPMHGHHPTVEIADASDINKKDVIGLAGEDIAVDSHGYVVVRGYIEGLDTSNLTEGKRAHLGFATPGTLVSSAPGYPNYPMDVGFCLTSDATNGTLYVNIFDHTLERLRITADAHIDGNLTIDGNFTLHGSQSEIQLVNLAVSNSFVYLNSGNTIGATGTVFTGTGLDDAILTGQYEGTASSKTFSVKINGVGSGTAGVDTFIWSTDDFFTSSSTIDVSTSPIALENGIYVDFVSTTGHTLDDIWYGTVSPINIDTGWFSSRNTGETGVGYTHIGVFYDISDNKYKFVGSYGPEPSGDIDTADPTFELATIAATTVEANVIGDIDGAVLNGLNAISGVSIGTANSGDILYFDGYDWVNKYLNSVPAQSSQPTITLNEYVLSPGDEGLFIEINSSAATTITIPASETFPIGTQFAVMQTGTGSVTIDVETPGTQTLNYSPGNTIRGQWAAATIMKRATDSWVIYGDLIA